MGPLICLDGGEKFVNIYEFHCASNTLEFISFGLNLNLVETFKSHLARQIPLHLD